MRVSALAQEKVPTKNKKVISSLLQSEAKLSLLKNATLL